MALRSYHIAWLSVHPDRSERWLKDKLKDGFDVHHVDGDHSNDAPGNLILVEAVDHMRMHGMKLIDGLTSWRKNLGKRSAQGRARKKAALVVYEAAEPLSISAPIVFAPVSGGIDHLSALAYMSRQGRS